MSKKGSYDSRDGSRVRYRSGWELAMMRWLDANDDVETWRYEPLDVHYVASESSSKIRRYTPDFLIAWKDGTRELVEIKPLRRINRKVIKKAEAAAEIAHEIDVMFSIMTEIELKTIGVCI